MSKTGVQLVEPDRQQLEQLLPVARQIFTETFKHLYEGTAFENFCDGVYRPGGTMSHDFDNPQVHWQVAIADGYPIGYAKLTPLRAPVASASPQSIELQQIYVLRDWHGTGVAANLMAWSLLTARSQQAREIYLTVFDHNLRAKRFYARHGFVEVGRCSFQIGNRVDDDRIWRARLDT